MQKVFAIALMLLISVLPAKLAWSAKPATQAQAAAQKKKLEAVQAQIKKLSEDQKQLELQRAEANKSVREMDAKVAEASKQARKSQQQLMARKQVVARTPNGKKWARGKQKKPMALSVLKSREEATLWKNASLLPTALKRSLAKLSLQMAQLT